MPGVGYGASAPRAGRRARTPIIALTANAMAHQVREYRAADMDGFVAKPIEIGKLFDAMEMVLNTQPERHDGVAPPMALPADAR